MIKKEIVEKIIEALKHSEDFEKVIPDVRELKSEFVNHVKEEHEKLRKEFDESGSPGAFKAPHDEWDGKFSDLMATFNQRKKSWEEKKAHELNHNLEIKKGITAELRKLIEEEHHIGQAFTKFNELKDRWKNTGPVPNADYKDLQREYSHLIEEFFYNINIYKTLKEYDLQKNLKLKLELTTKVRDLMTNTSIREVRDMITLYIQEWDEIGPTQQSQWEKVRDEFWDNVRQVHKRIGDYYKEQKEKTKENLTAKEQLCERVEAMVSADIKDVKQWNRNQKDLRSIQDEWRKIGFAGKKTNDEVWERFRKALNNFYDRSKKRMDEMKEVFKNHEEEKLKIILRAEQLKDSMDWKSTGLEYKKLQAEWKRIGSGHPAREQKLWKKFRSATEHFFKRSTEYRDGREDREKNNLVRKKEILQRLIDFNDEGETGLAALQKLGKEWNVIGYVPREEKQKLEDDFARLLSAKMKALGIKPAEIETHVYEFRIEGFKDSENSAELLRNEYNHLDEKLRRIEADIKQYENNLGFFGKNTDNPLVKEVQQKIENSRQEAGRIKSKMKKLHI